MWRAGRIRYDLHGAQLKILDSIESHDFRKFFVLCSRRLGKSHLLLTYAFEVALNKPGARVLYLAPYAKDAASVASDLATQVLKDCPADLRPDYKAMDKEFHFRNGSVVRLKGVNGEHAQFLRGGAADVIILDECGLMDDLKHVVSDVCTPMLMTTRGRLILASTPPRSPSHESTTIYEDLAGSGATALFTIREPVRHIDDDGKCRALVEAGEDPAHVADILAGRRPPVTTTARREYFCEFVTDSSTAVVKEYTDDARREIVREYERPPYFDAYVSMDPGMKDRTGILFGYWDFVEAKLVIEDELLLRGPNTNDIAEAIKAKEAEHWAHRHVHCRVSDVDLRLIADLYAMHGLVVVPARKEDSLGAVNLMRNMVHTRTLVIHPRCVNLDRQLRNATWNNKATDFERGGADSIDGHYDLVAALKYLCRTVNRTRNPYPDHWFRLGGQGGPPAGSWISPKTRRTKDSLGLYGDTPFGRRLAKRRK